MNEEACMSRKGLDPVSRKTKTPGRKKSGFVVYLAYQLLDNVGPDQMVGEAINKTVDINQKKKQLLTALTEVKLLPQIDERLRKGIKELKEFMSKDQLSLVYRLREVKEPESVEMLKQFLGLLKSGRNSGNSAGFMGLPQFLNFLNKSNEEGNGGVGSSVNRSSSRMSITSPKVPTRSSTLPRPTSGRASVVGGNRKPSFSSQTYSAVSSRSTTPDTPQKNGEYTNGNGRVAAGGRRESSLASIPSSGSGSSTPETLRKQEHRASMKPKPIPTAQTSKTSPRQQLQQPVRNGKTATSGRPTPSPRGKTGSRNPPQARSSAKNPSAASGVQLPGGRSGTPRSGVSSTRSSVNGDSPSRRMSAASSVTTPNSSVTNSPRMSSSVGGRRNKREPPSGKIITREDLRRMNKSYPSNNGKSSSSSNAAKTSSSSFSRTSIPMS